MDKELTGKQISKISKSSYKKNRDVEDIDGYTLDRGLSTSEAKVFVNKDKNKVVIANRGTNPTLKDWTNNLALLLGQYKNTKRFQNARQIQVEAKDKYPSFEFLNVGHSQSAKITKLLNEENLTDKIVNINPATLPSDKKKKNETTIRSNDDIVSTFDKFKKGDIVIESKTGNPILEHKTDIVSRLGDEKVQGSGHHSKWHWFN